MEQPLPIEQSDLILKEGVYMPRPLSDFPNDPLQRVVKVKQNAPQQEQYVFDESYPYLNKSFKYWFHRHATYSLLVWGVLFPHVCISRGLKIKGREYLRKYKKELKNGAVSVCNHMYQFDALCVIGALRPLRRMWIPILRDHFNGGQRFFVTYVGGIPVPDTRAGMRKFDEAFDEFHSRGEWIHVFPEAVRWDDYLPIRPFQKGAFTMAYKYDCPVVPCVITYRERKGIYKLFGKADNPLITINICEPILPDHSLRRKEAVEMMRDKAHAAMVERAGIVQNPWPSAAGE